MTHISLVGFKNHSKLSKMLLTLVFALATIPLLNGVSRVPIRSLWRNRLRRNSQIMQCKELENPLINEKNGSLKQLQVISEVDPNFVFYIEHPIYYYIPY